ncbi:MAG: two-component regulator propeller domain-containing protein [Ferruginibacter sp.]
MAINKIYAQDFPNLKLELLSTANGLPTNEVTSVFQDSRGLIWLGTENDGLLRYDGKKTKAYFNKNNFISNYIGQVCEDKNGLLWVSSLIGLYHFDPNTEKTILYSHDPNDKTSIATDEKPEPFVDSRGRLWVAGSNGLQQFDSAQNKFTNYFTPSILNPDIQKEFNHLAHILEDSKKRLWVGSAYGLYSIDTFSHRLIPFYTGSYNFVTSIIETTKKRMFVGFFGKGMKEFDPDTGIFSDIDIPFPFLLTIKEWQDENKNNWLCILFNNSIALLNMGNYQYRIYSNDQSNPASFKGLDASCLYKDKDNRLWISTSAGINIVDLQQQHFTNKLLYTDIQKNDPNSFGLPKALLELKDKYLMSAWYRRGLFEYDKEWNLTKIIPHIPPGSVSDLSRGIYTIQQDDEGNIWYGTDSGLIRHAGENYQYYLPPDSFPNFENKYRALNIVKRKDGLYWSVFHKTGIYLFDAKSGKFIKNYLNQYQSVVYKAEADNTGRLYFATAKGLYAYDERSDSFTQILIKHNNKLAEKSYNYINHFIFDNDNICWIATDGGLIKFTPATGKTDFITDPWSTSGYKIIRVLKDKAGVIWMIAARELIAYHPGQNSFQHYTSANGLPVNFRGEFSIFRLLDDSTILMGSARTLTTFNPYRLLTRPKSSSILFTDISVDGQRNMPPGPTENGYKLIVPAGSNKILIHFALLNYAASQQNKLYYSLTQGKQKKEWAETPDGDIMLLNLPPGEYNLQVKGSNTNLLNPATSQLIISIQPFWYQSILFKTAILFALALAIYIFIRLRIHSVKSAAFLKQRVTETEMAALKAQMNPHFMFNCINSIDAFIQSNDKYNATLYLNKFAKLIRNVLDSSKQNFVTFSKDIETLKLYIELEELRSENKFITNITINEELMSSDYKVPALIIQPFVENAIIHGLRNKETNDGILSINISKTEEQIVYSITDNGIGRAASQKINKNKEKSYGSEMSYDRIKLFNKETTASVTINDLYENEKATGTHILINLNFV